MKNIEQMTKDENGEVTSGKYIINRLNSLSKTIDLLNARLVDRLADVVVIKEGQGEPIDRKHYRNMSSLFSTYCDLINEIEDKIANINNFLDRVDI